jgi:hypothetical protein
MVADGFKKNIDQDTKATALGPKLRIQGARPSQWIASSVCIPLGLSEMFTVSLEIGIFRIDITEDKAMPFGNTHALLEVHCLPGSLPRSSQRNALAGLGCYSSAHAHRLVCPCSAGGP